MEDDIVPHLSWIFEAGAVVAGIFYLYYRRLRHRMLKVRCANMLLVELGGIWSEIDLAKGNYTPDAKAYQDLPSSVYNGLITSTNLSHFDVKIQGDLHDLYAHIQRYNEIAAESRKSTYRNRPMAEANLKELINKWDAVLDSVEEFRDKHEPEGSERSVAVMFSLLDKE